MAQCKVILKRGSRKVGELGPFPDKETADQQRAAVMGSGRLGAGVKATVACVRVNKAGKRANPASPAARAPAKRNPTSIPKTDSWDGKTYSLDSQFSRKDQAARMVKRLREQGYAARERTVNVQVGTNIRAFHAVYKRKRE